MPKNITLTFSDQMYGTLNGIALRAGRSVEEVAKQLIADGLYKQLEMILANMILNIEDMEIEITDGESLNENADSI